MQRFASCKHRARVPLVFTAPCAEMKYYFVDFYQSIEFIPASSGVRRNTRGNPVQTGDGPAAVTGDERCIDVTDPFVGWEDAASRVNRKSEDLPERY